jgi:hypothetical protein
LDLISDRLLDEYFEQDALFLMQRKQRVSRMKKLCASVACLCVAFVLGAFTMAYLQADPTEQNAPYLSPVHTTGMGESITAAAGQTVILDLTPGTELYSFTVTKEEGKTPFYLYMSDYAVVEEWIEEKEQYIKMIVPASEADESQRGQDMIIMPMFMMVNGIPTNEMPTQAGEYRVELGYAQTYTVKKPDPETLLQMAELMANGQFIYEEFDGNQ